MEQFWTDILIGDGALFMVGTGGAAGALESTGAGAGAGGMVPAGALP